MSDWNLIINAIDINHDNKISSQQEVKKAKELGIEAEEGERIEKVIEKTSKVTLQEALQKLDQTQTVDNKFNQNQDQDQDYMKKKRFMALG